MRSCPRTQAYIARRTAEGKTTREIRRCLKRYITRELYRTLTTAMTRSRDQLTSSRPECSEPLDKHRSNCGRGPPCRMRIAGPSPLVRRR